MRNMYYLKAVSEAIFQEMEKDQNIIVLGEDIRKGARGITSGMVDKFGSDRVIDTPISESGFTGVGTGAAFLGLRPVIEYQQSEFIFYAFDQLIDQAQKFHYMSGGKLTVPVTYIIATSGGRGGMAGQHSDNPYPYVLHAGVKTVLPSTPYDAKGLTVSAIREDDPVIVFLPANSLGMKGDVPAEEYSIPLGVGDIKKEGEDLTVVAVGHLVSIAVELAQELEEKGISIEVYDPRSLLPLDIELLKKSVSKTKRLIIFDDSNRTCGFAADVSSIIAEECFDVLKAPIKIVARADVPVPFSRVMESYALPSKEKLYNAINSIFQFKNKE